MTTTGSEAQVAPRTARWEKPGPGTWDLDASHCGPAPGPIQRALYEECLARGIEEGLAEFGSPLKRMEMRWVNGKFYQRLVPLIGGDRDLRPPPTPVLWLVSRLHPTFRRQERRAAESFATKRFRAEIERWESEWKPSIVADNRAFAAIDPSQLDDAELAQHVEDLFAHLRSTTTLHFRLHVSDMGPLGDLMVHLETWGLTRDDTFRALVAASPATGEPAARLREVADAVRDAGLDPSGVSSIEEVLARGDRAGALLADYLRDYGWRLTTGYDIEDRCLQEMPDVVLSSLRTAAATAPADASGARADQALEQLRDEVPPEHRERFDELVEDARLSYGLRDENGPITYEWPAGLLRRALLEAGRRLAPARLGDPGQVFELDAGEVSALLRGENGPGADEIAARAEERRWWATLEPPERLGPESPPPPVAAMPPNLARITRIVLTVVDTLEAGAGREPLSGTGVGTAPYVGRARVVRDPMEAWATMEPGDVVVAPYTAPTYNAVLAMAGAIVTEEGGLLCHAAVIARELGLPALIGTADAMARIPDGAMVEVDPAAGLVRVLS